MMEWDHNEKWSKPKATWQSLRVRVTDKSTRPVCPLSHCCPFAKTSEFSLLSHGGYCVLFLSRKFITIKYSALSYGFHLPQLNVTARTWIVDAHLQVQPLQTRVVQPAVSDHVKTACLLPGNWTQEWIKPHRVRNTESLLGNQLWDLDMGWRPAWTMWGCAFCFLSLSFQTREMPPVPSHVSIYPR